jgi:molecular chaperone GrpE
MSDETQAAAGENGQSAAEAGSDPVAELRGENAALKDRALRLLAEMENLRRRTEREVADSRTYGIASFARDVLGVADNMHRALDATGPDWRGQADAAGQALYEGVELTERELVKVLEKHGVKKLDPLGQKFDPNLHQAMFEVPDASVPAGTIVQVLQAGFTIGERILRPALVGVAKGGPKASTEAAQNDNQPHASS